MYATRDGKPIEDLKVDEIDILEDGVLQKIDAFEHVRVRTAPQESRIEPNTITQSREMAGNPRARVFVIFMDTYHTQIEGSAIMRQPLINLVDRLLGPDDFVALMTPEMSATEITLGRKTTVITKLLEREWMWGRRGRIPGADNDEFEDLYDACYPPIRGIGDVAAQMKARRREKMTLDALEDLMVHLAGIREERKAVVAVSEGWRLYRRDRQARAAPWRELRFAPVTSCFDRRGRSHPIPRSCKVHRASSARPTAWRWRPSITSFAWTS